MNEADILRTTMTDRATVTRQRWNGAGWKTETIYEGLECALSRSPQAATPALTGEWAEAAETGSRMALFFPAGTVVLGGDRVEITRGDQVFCGICSASLPYPGHCQATLLLQEVKVI